MLKPICFETSAKTIERFAKMSVRIYSLWLREVPEFEEYVGASHPHTPQIRSFLTTVGVVPFIQLFRLDSHNKGKIPSNAMEVGYVWLDAIKGRAKFNAVMMKAR